MRGSDYAELKAFMAVAEHTSFQRAAAQLALSPSALSQTIKALEARLATRLFNRTTRSVALTTAGQRLLAELRPALLAVEAAQAAVRRDAAEPSGRLRLNATRLAVEHCLGPWLADFSAACPQVQVEISVDERLVDIVGAGFDAGIRLGERVPRDMIGLPLGPAQRMRVVAASAYLEAHPTPNHPRELKAHRCLGYARPSDGSRYRWEFERAGKRLEVAVDGPLWVSDPLALTPLVLAGAGIAYLFEQQVLEHLHSGRLRPLLEDWTPPFPGFQLYYPNRHYPSAALRAFIEFAQAQAARGSA